MKRILSLAASLAFSISGAALAQTTAQNVTDPAAVYSVATSSVGRWLYDLQGNKIGSVRRLTDDGQTAEIMVGSYFQPGSHTALIPASTLTVVNGKTTVRNDTVVALNTVPRR